MSTALSPNLRPSVLLVSLVLAGAFVFAGLTAAQADDTFAAQGQPSRGWSSCSHLAPWNGVEYFGGRGAVVIKTRKMKCRKAAKKLLRSKLDRSRDTVKIRKWRCRHSGTFFEGSYTTCKRYKNGRVQRIRILADR